eukprot:g1460.t1
MGNKSAADRARDTVFDLKLTSKSIGRQQKKACAKQKSALEKVKKVRDPARARIYANDAIRHKNEANNLLRLQSRLDAVVSRVESAAMMSEVTPQMSKVVRSMKGVIGAMNPEKIGRTMEKFNTLCENLDVQVAGVESGIASTTASTTGESEIDELMQKTAAEVGMKIDGELARAGTVSTKDPERVAAVNADKKAEQELEDRLRKLRADPLAMQ